MIRRIDHIAIAVRDLESAKRFFIDVLGGRELFSAPIEDQKFRWTTIELGTSCFIELIDPLEDEGFLYRFLQGRGEGPHHITIQVNDIQALYKHLQEHGIPTFGYGEPLPNWKELFIHPKDAFGTLIQFAEFDPLDWINPGYVPPSYREFLNEDGYGDPSQASFKVTPQPTPKGDTMFTLEKGGQQITLTEEEIKVLCAQLKQGQGDRWAR